MESIRTHVLHDGHAQVDVLTHQSGEVVTVVPLALYYGAGLRRLIGAAYEGENPSIDAALLTKANSKKKAPEDPPVEAEKRRLRNELRNLSAAMDQKQTLVKKFSSLVSLAGRDKTAYLREVLEGMKLANVNDNKKVIEILRALETPLIVGKRPIQLFQMLKRELAVLARSKPEKVEAYLLDLGFQSIEAPGGSDRLILPNDEDHKDLVAWRRLLSLLDDSDSGVAAAGGGFQYDQTRDSEKRQTLEMRQNELTEAPAEPKTVAPGITPVIQLRGIVPLEQASENLDAILMEIRGDVMKALNLDELHEGALSFELGLLALGRSKKQLLRALAPAPVAKRETVKPKVVTAPPSGTNGEDEFRVVHMEGPVFRESFRFDPELGAVDLSGSPIETPTLEKPVVAGPAAAISLRERLGLDPVVRDPRAFGSED